MCYRPSLLQTTRSFILPQAWEILYCMMRLALPKSFKERIWQSRCLPCPWVRPIFSATLLLLHSTSVLHSTHVSHSHGCPLYSIHPAFRGLLYFIHPAFRGPSILHPLGLPWTAFKSCRQRLRMGHYASKLNGGMDAMARDVNHSMNLHCLLNCAIFSFGVLNETTIALTICRS